MAHLILGESAYRSLGVDVVTFVPAGDPWQKSERVVTTAGHRVAMVKAAVSGVEYFEVDDRETKRTGPSFTIDTLESFSGDDDLWLVLGADAAGGIRSWHRAEEVLARARLAVAMRPGEVRTEVEESVGATIKWLDMAETSISGTEIRRRAGEGESVRFLVPDLVWRYIEAERIYG